MSKQEDKIYIYTDKNGNPLYQQIRYYKDENKNFYSKRFENGEWKNGLKNVERVLYKLPDVVNGVSKAQNIYFVEGEKDVETLIQKGKIATTILGGANQEWKDSYTEPLIAANVIIIPDNDKAGQEFATRVANSLAGNANTVKIIQLTDMWPELKEKGDITDVFEMVKNDNEVLEKLEELVEKTNLYLPKLKKEVVKEKSIAEKQEDKQEYFEIKELGIKLKVPENYRITLENGVQLFYYSQKKKIPVMVSPVPIIISKVLRNMQISTEKLELSYYKKGRWESLIVDKNIIYNSRNIVNLANKGLPITSTYGKRVVDWLYELEIVNSDNLKEEMAINRFGWINEKTFIPYRCNDVHLDLDMESGAASWLERFNMKKGTIEEWTQNIKEFLEDDESKIIRFAIAVRF